MLINEGAIVWIHDQCPDLRDYKFYCFNGRPVFCHVIGDRFQQETMDFFDMSWKLQPFTKEKNSGIEYPHGKNIREPICYAEMKKIAQKLSENIPFSRIDLYEINNRIYFGEITFYPNSGLFNRFSPDLWDEKIGELFDI